MSKERAIAAIRVYPSSRKRLKVLAAKENVSIAAMVSIILSQ